MPELRESYSAFIAGRRTEPNHDLVVLDKFTREPATRVPLLGPDAIAEAIDACVRAAEPLEAFPSHARRAVLRHCAARFRERSGELALALCVEAGKPIGDSEGEVARLIETFEIAAEEATRIGGEVIPFDISPRVSGYHGMTRRVPIGPCAFITPFNFPLNLVAHKVAPAIAAGCPFVLKPADRTPVGALLIAEVLAETDLPEGAFSVVPCAVEHAAPLVEDERLRLLSFTGSDRVGRELAHLAGMKRIVLELGGNAACIVDEHADLDRCVERLLFGGYAQSGQSCVSVQRVIAHASLYDELRDRLTERVGGLRVGDPKERSTSVGPVIDGDAAERIESWIREAVDAGARVLTGGSRTGVLVEPTLLEAVPRSARVVTEEVFGPVVVLSRFDEFDAALDEANDSRYGLQAGVFTGDLRRAYRAWDRLRVGGVIVNDVPSFRLDHMPYGGVKHSGLGREGVRSAIEHMTEPRLLIVHAEG
ncbi:MAG: aldehyde dehydrogenase family protein [Phycisphaerales bacterium]